MVVLKIVEMYFLFVLSNWFPTVVPTSNTFYDNACIRKIDVHCGDSYFRGILTYVTTWPHFWFSWVLYLVQKHWLIEKNLSTFSQQYNRCHSYMLAKSLLVLKKPWVKMRVLSVFSLPFFWQINESEMFLCWVDLHQNILRLGDVSSIKVGNKWILLLLFTSSNLGAYWAREALNIFRTQARVQMGAPGWCPLLSTPSTHRAKDFICTLPSTSKLCLHPLTDICPSSSLQAYGYAHQGCVHLQESRLGKGPPKL